VEVVDVDSAVATAGGEPDDRRPLDVLGTPNPDQPGERTFDGVWRRLAATLTSLSARATGNTDLRVGPSEQVRVDGPGHPQTYRSAFSWVSFGGSWSTRAWTVTGTLEVTVDDYLATRIRVVDPTVTVVGRTGATTFTGQTLAGGVRHARAGALSQEQARTLAGLPPQIGGSPVQASPHWSAEKFAALVYQLRDGAPDAWFVGQSAFKELFD
jgi:hypothetical protein